MRRSGGVRFVAAALLAVAAGGSVAQTPPPGSPLPRVAPQTPPATSPTLPPAPLPPLAVPQASVAVSGVAIEGATAYPVTRLLALIGTLSGGPLIGRSVSLQAIEAARRAILLQYRNDGFPFVVVKARLDKAGLLHFTVSEGYIAEVKLAGDIGNIGPVGTLVLRFLNHLTEQRPINTASIEHWVLLAQSIPGLQIQPLIEASEREPGAFTLVAQVSRRAITGSLTADNRAFRKTGAEEGLLTLDANSLTALGERTEVSLYGAGPNGREIFGQASEQVFVGSAGLSVRLYGGAGDTTPCCDLAAIGYDGRTTVFGAQVSYPLLLSRQQQLYLRADFDALDSATLEQGSRASADDLRVLRLEAEYSLSDTLLGAAFAGSNSVFVRVSHGLQALGASANGRSDAGRLGESLGFTKASAELSRDQTLVTLPDGPRLSLYGLAAGQVSRDVLPTAEQFYLGGLRYTRGFYSGEVTGDNALVLTAEVRVSFDIDLDLFGTPLALSPQVYGFYDWGETWQNQSTDRNQRLRSLGIGVRSGITQQARLELEALHRVTRNVDGAEARPLPSDAVYWRVVTVF